MDLAYDCLGSQAFVAKICCLVPFTKKVVGIIKALPVAQLRGALCSVLLPIF